MLPFIGRQARISFLLPRPRNTTPNCIRAEEALRQFELRHAIADPDDQLSNLAEQFANSVGTLHLAEETMAADEQRIREDQSADGDDSARD